MAEALINLIDKNINTDNLTAQESDIFDGATFIGAGSENIRKGTGITQGAPQMLLGINGSVNLPAGKYTGGKVYQSVPVMNEYRVYPTSKNITIPTKDMYMGGNIVQNAIANLVPENIKLGEYVGGVGPGTWEGYVVTDPDTFYMRGAFPPGQSFTSIPYSSGDGDVPGIVILDKKHIRMSKPAGNGERNVAALFDAPIDISTKNKLTVSLDFYTNHAGAIFYIRGYRSKASSYYDGDKGELVFSEYHNASESGVTHYDITTDLSLLSRYIYLYACVEVSNAYACYLDINKVQFE